MLLIEDDPEFVRAIKRLFADVRTPNLVASGFDVESADRLSTGLARLEVGESTGCCWLSRCPTARDTTHSPGHALKRRSCPLSCRPILSTKVSKGEASSRSSLFEPRGEVKGLFRCPSVVIRLDKPEKLQ